MLKTYLSIFVGINIIILIFVVVGWFDNHSKINSLNRQNRFLRHQVDSIDVRIDSVKRLLEIKQEQLERVESNYKNCMQIYTELDSEFNNLLDKHFKTITKRKWKHK